MFVYLQIFYYFYLHFHFFTASIHDDITIFYYDQSFFALQILICEQQYQLYITEKEKIN